MRKLRSQGLLTTSKTSTSGKLLPVFLQENPWHTLAQQVQTSQTLCPQDRHLQQELPSLKKCGYLKPEPKRTPGNSNGQEQLFGPLQTHTHIPFWRVETVIQENRDSPRPGGEPPSSWGRQRGAWQLLMHHYQEEAHLPALHSSLHDAGHRSAAKGKNGAELLTQRLT